MTTTSAADAPVCPSAAITLATQAGAMSASEVALSAAAHASYAVLKAKQDEHVASMMHELPSNPDGLIDAQTGKAQLMSEIVAEHTVRVDLSFPSLESFRRAEHDVASYFMPDYSAHLSEPHGGGGGFWSGVRAETRRARLAPDDESHSTGSHRRPRHGGSSGATARARRARPSLDQVWLGRAGCPRCVQAEMNRTRCGEVLCVGFYY